MSLHVSVTVEITDTAVEGEPALIRISRGETVMPAAANGTDADMMDLLAAAVDSFVTEVGTSTRAQIRQAGSAIQSEEGR